ncbi:MAG: hypothetical protein HOV87_18185, partial [Catenulispora sp.]|nr:hypothetical protein [Catenulispora sp.]
MMSNHRLTGRSGRRAAVVLGAAALGLATALPANAATHTATNTATHTAQTTSHLVGLSVQSYAAYDRVILTVSSVPGYTVTPTDVLTRASSGKDVTLPGANTYLDVELNPADTLGFTGPTQVTTGFSEVTAVAELSSWEGYTQVGIGLNHAAGYTVTVLSPTQL